MRKSTIVTTIMALATMATVNVNAATAITSSKGLNACLGMYGWERQEHYSVPANVKVTLSGSENDELVGFYYDGMELFIQPWCLNYVDDDYTYEESYSNSSYSSSNDNPDGAYDRVDVNLSTQMIKYYDMNGNVAMSAEIMSGMTGHETPTGWYNILYKESDTYLRGTNNGVDYNKHVDYWMPFINTEKGSQIGFHDADWKSVYAGGNATEGSLGCINMNCDDAGSLYNLVNSGTTVYVHY